MKIQSQLLIALALTLLAACGGAPPAAQAGKNLDRVISVLTSITDVDSAKANKDELAAAIRAQAKFGEAQAEKAKNMSVEEIAAEEKEMAEQIKNMAPRIDAMMAEIKRVTSDPEIAAALGNALTGGGE